MAKVILLNGSPHEKGCTWAALNEMAQIFEKEGIEYFQPEIHLIIGRSPEISNAQWRRIISDESSLNILTYDDIYKSAELRLKAFSDIINN